MNALSDRYGLPYLVKEVSITPRMAISSVGLPGRGVGGEAGPQSNAAAAGIVRPTAGVWTALRMVEARTCGSRNIGPTRSVLAVLAPNCGEGRCPNMYHGGPPALLVLRCCVGVERGQELVQERIERGIVKLAVRRERHGQQRAPHQLLGPPALRRPVPRPLSHAAPPGPARHRRGRRRWPRGASAPPRPAWREAPPRPACRLG